MFYQVLVESRVRTASLGKIQGERGWRHLLQRDEVWVLFPALFLEKYPQALDLLGEMGQLLSIGHVWPTLYLNIRIFI